MNDAELSSLLDRLKSSLGERIKIIREQAGYTSQEELADNSGLKRNSIKDWERGATAPEYRNLVILSEFLKVGPAAFLPTHVLSEGVNDRDKELNKIQSVLPSLSLEDLIVLRVFIEALGEHRKIT